MSHSIRINGERQVFGTRTERIANVLQEWVLQDWVFQLGLVVAVVGGLVVSALSLSGSIA
jgi:hypothetical protein